MHKQKRKITYYVIDDTGNIVSGHFAQEPARRRATAIGGTVERKDDYHAKRRGRRESEKA